RLAYVFCGPTRAALRDPAMRAGLFRLFLCLVLICAGPLTLLTGCKHIRHHAVYLDWHPPDHSPVEIAGYNIYRSRDGEATFHKLNTSPVRKPKYVDKTVQSGMTYRYQVKSVDKKGVESGPSNQITLKVP
ncbi:MAG TPA: fibronectin type III domain-containing protein, partial [Terracidiphilus sp.]